MTNRQREIVDRDHVAERLGHVLKPDVGELLWGRNIGLWLH